MTRRTELTDGENMTTIKRSIVAASLLASAVSMQAMGATNSTNFTVSATVAAYCTVSVPTGISGLSSSNHSATASMTIECTNGTSWTVGLAGLSNAADGVFRMKDATTPTPNYIRYSIAATSSDSNVTSKPTAVGSTSNRIGGSGAGGAQSVTLTANATLGTSGEDIRFAAPGSYSDTVTATVEF
jgi:spore coat protein U-like protein